MATHLHRFLLLPLLLFLPSALLSRRGTPPSPSAAAAVYPVVLVPGNTCSQLEARLTGAYTPPPGSPQCGAAEARGRWFRLWRNGTGMADPAVAPCLADQLRVVYDPAAGDFRDVPGVETRVLGFGSTADFLADTDASRDLCMGRLVDALQRRAGYRDGETLFGAPFDFRQAPAPRGQPCRAFARFSRRLRKLVERASMANGGKPVVLVSHSQGGYFALEFLDRSPLPWRRRFVRHYVMASMAPGGLLLGMRNLATSPGQAVEAPDALVALPSPAVYGAGTGAPPLVVTRERNYTASDMAEYLAAVGVPPLGVALYENRALPVQLGFRAPVVPTTCINGVGVPTMQQLVFGDGNFSAAPEVVYGDGDGLLPLASILALDTLIGGDPRQEYYKSILLADTPHAGVVSDAAALKRVVEEILWSNPM